MRIGLALLLFLCACKFTASPQVTPPPPAPQTLDLASFVAEMRDPLAVTRFPDPPYEQLQASSYHRASTSRFQTEQDTNGWFADSDGTGFLRVEGEGDSREWVIMEHDGPGCLTRLWTPFFHHSFDNRRGPRIKIYLDGAPEPAVDAWFIELLTNNAWSEAYGPAPERANSHHLPIPLAGFTARAGDLYLPIPFAESCKITLDDRSFYYLVNYRAYPPGTQVRTFDWAQFDALGLSESESLTMDEAHSDDRLNASRLPVRVKPLAIEYSGPAVLTGFTLTLDPEQLASHPQWLRELVVEVEADGELCVWCPVGDLFASPDRLRPHRTWRHEVSADGRFTMRWPMPFRDQLTVRVHHLGDEEIKPGLEARVGPYTWTANSMHFHAGWRPDEIHQGDQFEDWNFVTVEGRGVFVGDTLTALAMRPGWWGEGDEKIYVDLPVDAPFPTHFGSGTEDYYGWAGGRVPTRLDMFSHPFLANTAVGSTEFDNPRGFNVCHRARGLDAIPFQERLEFTMELSPGVDQRRPIDLMGYSAVTLWYAAPGARSNRGANPAAVREPRMCLADLDQRSAEIAEQLANMRR